jgi:hypothetical protein
MEPEGLLQRSLESAISLYPGPDEFSQYPHPFSVRSILILSLIFH